MMPGMSSIAWSETFILFSLKESFSFQFLLKWDLPKLEKKANQFLPGDKDSNKFKNQRENFYHLPFSLWKLQMC